MLDVHPPHHAASTWRDFFIHIITIVIGLLIAIGLEQTVEYFHHRHQRHQLEEDLHAEGLRNLHVALDNIRVSEQRRQSDSAQYAEFLLAARQHRAPTTFPTPPDETYTRPAYAVWTVAQQSGTTGLLPRADAERYVRLYGVVQLSVNQIDAINEAATKKAVARLPAVVDPSVLQTSPGLGQPVRYDLSLLSPEELRQTRDAIGNDISIAKLGISRNVYLYGIEWAILNGSRSDEENVRILYDAMDVYRQGGTNALLAKYPLPDAEHPPA
jgi:hypothetical protein